MSAILIVAVLAGVLVLGLLALGAALLVALRTTGDSVVALERRLREVEEQSGRVRDALSSVDGDLATMTARLTHDRDAMSDVSESAPEMISGSTRVPSTDPTSDTPMRGPIP